MAVLLLFGQDVDSAIRAFTETADWNLFLRDAPENINMISNDMHYLCTVAVSGHASIVRPKRLGVRHGHVVVVNRQLCVANAFEQILEERTPRLHKLIRYIYDHSGIHFAKMVQSKYMADFVYILMKPTEWLFLSVIYLADVHPENRIAIQYTGKGMKDFDANHVFIPLQESGDYFFESLL